MRNSALRIPQAAWFDCLCLTTKMVAMPHPPPCATNEIQYGNECYPRIDNLQVDRDGEMLNIAVNGVDPVHLSAIVRTLSDSVEVRLRRLGYELNIHLPAVPLADADRLFKLLGRQNIMEG